MSGEPISSKSDEFKPRFSLKVKMVTGAVKPRNPLVTTRDGFQAASAQPAKCLIRVARGMTIL